MRDTRAAVLGMSGKHSTGEGSAPITQDTMRLAGVERILPPPPALEPGFILGGRYELEEELGMGGAGRVYRARDRYVKTTVAVKVLRGDRAIDKKWIERFAREVRVAREIRHPNVCRVYEFGEADGYWYLTMEYADEGTLQEALNKRSVMRLKKGVIPAPRNPVADARAVCAGLAAIHTVGIVHRDVTPGNILRSNGRLLLTDFGLAIGEKEETTFHGGTPRFMAPEVIAGGAADQRSDVYQLGYLLHEVLFNKHPKWTHNDAGHRILSSPAAPDADPVEEAMAGLCLGCLSDNPALRPASAIVVAEKLAEAERAQRKSWVSRKWARVTSAARRPAVIATAALLCLASVATTATKVLGQQTLCAGGPARISGVWDVQRVATARAAFFATGRPDASQIFDAANQAIGDHLAQWLVIYKDACEATQLRGEQSPDVLDLRMGCLTEDLESVGVVAELLSRATPEAVDTAAFSVAANVRELGRCSNLNNLHTTMPLPKDPKVREQVDRIQRDLASVNIIGANGYDPAPRQAAARLAEEARATGYCPLIARTLIARAKANGLAFRGSDDQSILSDLTEALWTAESCGDDRDVARAGAELVYADRLAANQPQRWARLTEAALKRFGGDPEIEATLAYHLGCLEHHAGDDAAGVAHYRRAVAMAESLPGHLQLGLVLGALSDGLKDLGRYEEALSTSDRGIEVLTALLGSDSFEVAELLTNRGDLLTAMYDFEMAEAAYKKSLQVMERRLPEDSFPLTYPIAGIGKALLEQGSPARAVPWLERAAVRETGGDTYFEAGVKFDLARALCAAALDCARGRTFAQAARATYKQSPKFGSEELQVAAWMRDN